MINLRPAYALCFTPQHHYGVLAADCLQGLFCVHVEASKHGCAPVLSSVQRNSQHHSRSMTRIEGDTSGCAKFSHSPGCYLVWGGEGGAAEGKREGR